MTVEERIDLAKDINTQVETLVELSKDDNILVREEIARNPRWKTMKEAGILDKVIALYQND